MPNVDDPPQPTGLEVRIVAAAVAVSMVARFATRSPLWLDEALSVHIAELGVGDLLDALRRDGHPPLYYLLLHGWIDLFGTGDVAVRALSGIFSLAVLPLAWVAGRRRAGVAGGLAVLLLTAIAPFSIRYATETRMYSLLMVLVLSGWLLADDLRRGPDRRRWIALAVVTGMALLTHYWAMYVGAAAVGVLAWRWWRRGERVVALRIGSALAAGTVAFLPWLGSFLFQVRNTGTPWGTATRPTRALVDIAVSLGGVGTNPEAVLFGGAVLALAAVATVVSATGAHRMELDLRTVPGVRGEMTVALATLTIGLLVGGLTAATFQGRYGATFLPLVLIAAGVGLVRLPGRAARSVVATGLMLLAGVGIVLNAVDDRTQGGEFASTIAGQGAAGDVVAFCPDQLGPSTVRELPARFDAVGIPAFDDPRFVDWVDYADRNRSADPEVVTRDLLARAGDRGIWLVQNPTYRTYEDLCDGILVRLAAARPQNGVATELRTDVGENATLYVFRP